ncbi:hypothetical protein M0P48_01460 [Candidatus Gracilibacteria bacterium]|nr:hypothetical protein [Candidatus Gracilibacteria bacterium]
MDNSVKDVQKKIRISLRLHKKFFGVVFALIAVVMIWRGLWNLLDMYIFPEHPVFSNVFTFLLGMFLIYLPDEDIKDII